MKKISHITINTGHVAQYEDDSVIADEVRAEIQNMVRSAKETGVAEVLDGIVVEYVEDSEFGIYMATLYKDGIIPLIETSGATTKEAAEYLWDKMLNLHKTMNIIFPLLKFGNLQWMDAPYSVHLSKNLTHLEVPTEGTGLAMHIALYDTHTGKLCSNRIIGLSTNMSKKLIKIINEQKQKTFDRKEHDRNIRNVYAAYPTKKLVQMAIETFRLH